MVTEQKKYLKAQKILQSNEEKKTKEQKEKDIQKNVIQTFLILFSTFYAKPSQPSSITCVFFSSLFSYIPFNINFNKFTMSPTLCFFIHIFVIVRCRQEQQIIQKQKNRLFCLHNHFKLRLEMYRNVMTKFNSNLLIPFPIPSMKIEQFRIINIATTAIKPCLLFLVCRHINYVYYIKPCSRSNSTNYIVFLSSFRNETLPQSRQFERNNAGLQYTILR